MDDGAIDPDHAPRCCWSGVPDGHFSLRVSARLTPGRSCRSILIHGGPAGADSSDWQVIRKAGTEIRVLCKTKLSVTVGAQIPTGPDLTV